MRVLAIDPGTHCGWATWDGQHVESGAWDFSGIDSWASKWGRFQAEMWEHQEYAPLDALVYEEQQHIRGRYALLCWGWQVAILMFCHDAHVKPVPVNAKTLKKWSTGNGNASKADMIEAANMHKCQMAFGGPDDILDLAIIRADPPDLTQAVDRITDDNEADALCLLAYAREHYEEGRESVVGGQ